ncbi:hypothetical protein PAXINDRAFT_95578 [Paxillus involutus ATCC 200175]|nr:hypothetical protein PAXINDRAFT_95578 [Paxillus involutus ATCC 200175]
MLSLSLNHLPQPSVLETFHGHREIVWSVVFLPNGKEFVSSSSDGTVRLWRLNDPESGIILEQYNGAVFCLALLPDGKRLASGGLDRSVNIWDLDAQMVVDGPWKRHASSVRYIDVSSDCRYLASGSFDHNVNLWDTGSGQVVRDQASLKGDVEINCMKFSRKGFKLLTGSGDGCLRIWDWESGNLLLGPIKVDELPIWAVAWSLDETRILSGSSDGTLRSWHAVTGHVIGEPVHAHESIIYSLSLSHNGRCLASASSDTTVKIWNATTLEQLATLAHRDEVNCVSFSTDDRLLASACSDSLIYVWELPQASLDSGLAIDKDCEGASLLEPPSTILSGNELVIGGSRESERNMATLNEILGVPNAFGPLGDIDPDKEIPVADPTPAIVLKRRFTSRFSPARYRQPRVKSDDDLQPPKKGKRGISEILKAVAAKSGKFMRLW